MFICPSCGSSVVSTNVCDECGRMLSFDEFEQSEDNDDFY